MSYFDKSIIGDFTCSKCGNVYRIESTSMPDKEDDGVRCDCGNVIIERHRTRDNYSKEFLRKGDPADAVNNQRR